MAFAKTNTQAAPANETWKSQGFLNFYLPAKNGTRRKLGFIALKDSKPNEKVLLEWLMEDPSRVATILSKLEIDFQPAGGDTSTGFDL